MFKSFYGRIKGKSLSILQKDVLKRRLPLVEITLTDKFKSVVKNYDRVVLDIGFGHGESMLYNVIKSPKTLFIGAEIFVNGYATFLVDLEKYEKKNGVELKNFKIFTGDAVKLIEALPSNFVDEVLLFFPDPWHKNKHNKRRFVNQKNLKSFSFILKKGGIFSFASDISDYNIWTLSQVLKSKLFSLNFDKDNFYKKEPVDWCKTKYQKKAERIGVKSNFFKFVKK